MSISKEAIEAAAIAVADFDGSDWAALSDDDKDLYQIITTAALTAAAPYIQAAALRDAAGAIEENPYEDLDPFYADWLRARADHLEGETE